MIADGHDYGIEADVVEARPVADAAEARPVGPWGFWATIGFFLVGMAAFLVLSIIVMVVFIVV
ncbi:MAG: hypothetical protein ACYTF1_20885 [Planctomycetota bacterium]|jgi:hypothetical protein